MNAKKNQEDQKQIQKLMNKLDAAVRVLEMEFGKSGDPPIVKFIRNEGKVWTLKFNGQTFRLNIEVVE
jgi:hypothetical protein